MTSILTHPFPEITRDEVFMIGTKRLWLRWPRAEDAAELARIGGDPRVAARTGTWPIGADAAFAMTKIETQRARNASGAGFAFVIAPRRQWAQPIGLIGFNAVADAAVPTVVGGYHLAPERWGLGLMSEALAGMVEMIRLLTPVAILRASVMPDNPASAHVLRKAGFERVGVSLMTTEPRGTFPVETFERRLSAVVDRDADTAASLPPRFARVLGPPKAKPRTTMPVRVRREADV
jgi:RimJ/RimL family protein N-acetyltransferase